MESTRIHKQSHHVPSLPPELVSEILTRIPVKPLLKFRCVCKSWCSLISSPHFAKTHLNLSSRKSNNYSNYALVLVRTSNLVPRRSNVTCSLSSVLRNNGFLDLKVLDFHIGENEFIIIRGICNGLFCIGIGLRRIVLCNPATRKIKYLPYSNMGKILDCIYFSYGFCYDEEIDDYKIVEIYAKKVGKNESNSWLYHPKINVYSLKNDSWKTIVYPTGVQAIGSIGGGTTIRRVVYFVVTTDVRSCLILAIDTNTYTYRISSVKVSDLDVPARGINWSLGVIGVSLVVFCQYEVRVDAWVLNRGSLKKLASIPFPVMNPGAHLCPLFLLDNGIIFLESRPDLMLYDSREESLVNCGNYHGLRIPRAVHSPLYVESLVKLS